MARTYRIPVVAALIEKDGKLLIGQRKAGARHEFKWEFPGGKVEQGESPRAALARELREELGIEATVGKEITRYEFNYPKGASLLLIFLEVPGFSGELRNAIFEKIQWERRENLPSYDFLDGDLDFVKRLAAGEF
ncbi:MAG: (deoxy)nucleoside triphosphate pyrophosphohydrolase [Bryobacterales bacterium]|nr:(deoxy)nucleoside triphosphate pyrophosphohydrolase [Bryobacterales bacterium]